MENISIVFLFSNYVTLCIVLFLSRHISNFLFHIDSKLHSYLHGYVQLNSFNAQPQPQEQLTISTSFLVPPHPTQPWIIRILSCKFGNRFYQKSYIFIQHSRNLQSKLFCVILHIASIRIFQLNSINSGICIFPSKSDNYEDNYKNKGKFLNTNAKLNIYIPQVPTPIFCSQQKISFCLGSSFKNSIIKIQFIYYKMNQFKVCISLIFSICTELHNHKYKLILGHLLHAKKKSLTFQCDSHPHSLLQPSVLGKN